MWKIHRQKLITTAHLLTSKWANSTKVTFHAKIWFHKHGMPWLTHAVCADIRPWHRNCWSNISMTTLRVRSKFFRQKYQNCKHTSMLTFSWPIRVHFRWSCLRLSVCMAGGSSDSYHLCQFVWDSAKQTAHATRATGKWPNGLGEIPYRPRPIPLGWLTSQVSGDRA